jgi:hypothetical protein
VEKNGIRSIERLTGHHRDTIGYLLEDLALHAEFVNSILLHDVKLGQFEVDEMLEGLADHQWNWEEFFNL